MKFQASVCLVFSIGNLEVGADHTKAMENGNTANEPASFWTQANALLRKNLTFQVSLSVSPLLSILTHVSISHAFMCDLRTIKINLTNACLH